MIRHLFSATLFSSVYLERVDSLKAQGLLNAVGEVGVVEDDVEPEGLGPQRNSRPNSACRKVLISPQNLLQMQSCCCWCDGPRKGSEKRNDNLHIKTIERYFGLRSIAKICLHYPKYHLRAEEKYK